MKVLLNLYLITLVWIYDKDYFLVHCPERIDPGNKKYDVSNIPRVIGGLSNTALEKGFEIYNNLIDAEIRKMSTIRAAEMVKVVENTFRDVNIAYVNELAKRLNIKFVFTPEDKKIKGLKADYELVKGVGYKKYKIHFSLINILRKEKPSKVVMLPPDPLHLIDNIFVSEYMIKKKISFSIVVGRWKYKEKPLKQKITELFHKKILKNAECCLAYGSKSKDWLLELGVKKENIEIVYNINPHIYENFDEKKKKLLEFKNKKVILYVGRLLKIKGVDYLIKSFKEYNNKDVALWIVGNGREKPNLKRLAKGDKRIKFIGKVSHSLIPYYIKNADVCVVPYKKCSAINYVSLYSTLKVSEYLALKKPILCADVGDMKTTATNTNIIFYVADNEDDFIKKLDYLLNNKVQTSLPSFLKKGHNDILERAIRKKK